MATATSSNELIASSIATGHRHEEFEGYEDLLTTKFCVILNNLGVYCEGVDCFHTFRERELARELLKALVSD